MKWVCTVSILVFFGQVCPVIPLPVDCENLPRNISYVGCFEDKSEDRLLENLIEINEKLTPDDCIEKCRSHGYPFVGMEYSVECYCGSENTILEHRLDDKVCNMPCSGDLSKMCGADKIISVYTVNVCPMTPTPPNDLSYIGCFKDNVTNRLLPHFIGASNTLTTEYCIEECSKIRYPFAGVESGKECFCGGSAHTDFGNRLDESYCQMRCWGNQYQICGDNGMISIYSTDVCPVIKPSPKGIVYLPPSSYLGCFEDNGSTPILNAFFQKYPSLTPEYCINECSEHGFPFAGLKAGEECYCGNIDKFSLNRLEEGYCAMYCWGDKNKYCGDIGLISLYSIDGNLMTLSTGVNFTWWKEDNIFKIEEDTNSSSPFFYFNDYRLHVFLKTVNVDGSKRIRIFLYCNKGTEINACGTMLKFTFKVIRDGQEPFLKKTSFMYDSPDAAAGWAPFIDVKELLDGGYIKNGYVHFEAIVKLVT